MKRILSLMLALVLLLSLGACGGSQPVEETAATEAVTEPTTEPVTEPTLSPEEILYNSLPERTRQAYELGIVELEQLEDLERIVTIGEAAAMLQIAYVHRIGAESKALNELMTNPDYSQRNADRGWIWSVPGVTDSEIRFGDRYEDYQQWLEFLNQMNTEDLWWSYDDRLGMNDLYGISEDGASVEPGAWNALDADAFPEAFVEGSLYGPTRMTYYADVHSYGRKVFDSTNGKRFFEIEDAYGDNPMLLFQQELTVEEAAEYALIFYNYPNPMAYPTFVAEEEVGSFNPQIITPELLEKETDLPEASCQQLPASWHGVVMDDLDQLYTGNHLDYNIYEYEIQAVKEAGFNYIGLNLDFGWIQEQVLCDSSKDPYVGFVKEEDKGKFSLERLEQLDKIIALCMEYDIHVNLRCTGIGDTTDPGKNFLAVENVRNAGKLAGRWRAIARRYDEIPNEYLSFTVYTSGYNWAAVPNVKDALLIPSVEAVQEVSPERCIVADIFNDTLSPETFAQMGTALSCRILEPKGIFDHSDYYEYRTGFNDQGRKVVKNFSWPYKDKTDAAALLEKGKNSFQDVLAAAQEYGVGCMLSDFGVNVPGGNIHSTSRYADEEYREMIVDVTTTVEALGWGWCFAHWYGPYGVAFSMPAIANTVYEQVGEYPYYIDQTMLGWFQEINGVK